MQKNMTLTITEQHGQRLDQAIAPLCPDMGVRGRRRLWEHNIITVNGRPRPCGFCVANGDVVEIRAQEAISAVDEAQSVANPIDIIKVHTKLGLVAISKPSGIHSATIAGSPLPSVEALLPSLDFSGTGYNACKQPFPKLLNRLDGPTSGMLLVALDEAGLAAWTEAEELGTIEKTYFAVACGVIEKEQTVKTALDTANRQVTKILEYDTDDILRHTEVRPLAVFEIATEPAQMQAVTLVQCSIHKGARHQIRAHVASLGHPLLGDTVYGGAIADVMPTQLFLHHGRVQIADFTALCMPTWLLVLPQSVQERVTVLFSDDV